MPDGRDESRRLAILCFLPDRGHVQPLLRLASAIVDASDLKAECILPEEFEPLVRSFGFLWHPLPIASRADKVELFSRLSSRSLFRNAFTNFQELRHRHWAPLMRDAADLLPPVIEHMKATRPAIVLSDTHVFGNWYSRAAGCCGAKLVQHQALAPLTHAHREYVRVFGYRAAPRSSMALVETAGAVVKQLSRLWGVGRHPIRTFRARTLVRAAGLAAERAFAACDLPAAKRQVVHTGAGALNCLADHEGESVERKARFILFPASRSGHGGIPADLATWLESQSKRPIVYVCFGTMVRLGKRMVRLMAQGLLDAGVSVVWVLPGEQAALAPVDLPRDRIRVEKYLPQAEVLALDVIRGFVGCGGSGSILEALSSGKPVLSIPFMWDQTYNASVVARLGAGTLLEKRGLRASGIRVAVLDLVVNSARRRRARELQSILRDPPTGLDVNVWVRSLAI